jgi:hypothetical protein
VDQALVSRAKIRRFNLRRSFVMKPDFHDNWLQTQVFSQVFSSFLSQTLSLFFLRIDPEPHIIHEKSTHRSFYPIKPQNNLYDMSFSVFIFALREIGFSSLFLNFQQIRRKTHWVRNRSKSCNTMGVFSRGGFSSVRRCYGNLTLFMPMTNEKWKLKCFWDNL